MGRPKRDVQELMADQFADMDLATQDQMLLVLSSINRQARRHVRRESQPGGDRAPGDLFAAPLVGPVKEKE